MNSSPRDLPSVDRLLRDSRLEHLPHELALQPLDGNLALLVADLELEDRHVEGDPRGGVQSDEYRHADPRDIVQDGDVVMSGPGGTPQEGVEVEERRLLSGLWRRRRGRTGAVR